MSRLTAILSHYWDKIQGTLFPWLEEELNPLTQKQEQLIETLELIRRSVDEADYITKHDFDHQQRVQRTQAGSACSKVSQNFS